MKYIWLQEVMVCNLNNKKLEIDLEENWKCDGPYAKKWKEIYPECIYKAWDFSLVRK